MKVPIPVPFGRFYKKQNWHRINKIYILERKWAEPRIVPPYLFMSMNYTTCTLFAALNNKMNADYLRTEIKHKLEIIPFSIISKAAPLIFHQATLSGAIMYSLYLSISDEDYRTALPMISLVRFNMSNIYSNRGRVFTCGLDRISGLGYLYTTLDTPQPINEAQHYQDDLYSYMKALIESLQIDIKSK